MNSHPFRRKKLAEIAVETPSAIALFRKHNLDFCCGGDSILEDAARKLGIDENILFSELDHLVALPQVDTESMELTELCDAITTRYHQKHRQDLPELICSSNRVESVHKDHPNCPKGLTKLLLNVRDEMLYHMKQEEEELFPLIASESVIASSLLETLEDDHSGLGEQLRELEELLSAESLPDDACTTWRALVSGVQEFVTDVMEHVHTENNVLFPRVRNVK